ncbi:hypothetical protein [Streptomyces sp. DSM 40907]|uniref:hypothetical protein n=1 Tax=Streptomyces kutzneri TaxID=3051179 RepID=UPI0028D82EA2|nr:hypothetical protein [Streptomyces sp. DSM 40907]
MPKRIFVSFDYDYDKTLKDLLIGQAKNPDPPLEVHDWSIQEALPDWKVKARARISRTGKKPTTAKAGDKVYRWTWDNLKILVGGGR